ncbi:MULTISPECIES: 3-hydroxybutyrate dehydrogenase [Calditerrivibrio]|jgi:3-hydroxybutyrate dehydrogenase|uniref:D-beta-hydroxybutyrate dehydrogenase n=1 Tax=Calditerrivibrio nitroreducens TaxID=477976 RepID=A0A2J6WGR9_9BACT|nr:MAG: D-beta-hydroxybutyrate dehydrogenase [Calditerrivibrio nitroreducens]
MQDKVAVVTGASSGIGLAIAEQLSKAGCKVVMADINKEKGIEEAKRINAKFFQADLSKRSDCRDLINFAGNTFGSVDILVNNAGIQHVSPIEDFPEDKWDFMISLMLTAPFLLTKYSWNYMKEKKWGRIININSVHGLRASEFKSAYISAKHGLSGLTKTTALEGGKYGITVNSICPAYVRTPLVDNQIDAQAKTHGIPREKVIEEIMLKKAYVKRLIEPSEVGSMVLYLCSDAAQCITGSMITIDCGWTAS